MGLLLARSGTSDVVDAHLVILAVRLGDSILTGDEADLMTIADFALAQSTDHPTLAVNNRDAALTLVSAEVRFATPNAVG